MSAASTDNKPARQSKLIQSGKPNRIGPKSTVPTSAKKTWSANQTDRLAITPTTAAVRAAKPPLSRVACCNRSIHGAKVNIHMKQGANVTRSRQAGTEKSRNERREGLGRPEGRKKADMLGDKNQRSRCGFGKPQTVGHFSRLYPAVRLHCFLRHMRRAPHRLRRT